MGKPSPLLDALRVLGLYGLRSHEKFIPLVYLYNTPAVRLALLQGLMDTDGWVDSRGQPHLEQTSTRLADDVTTLVESLGGFVRRSEKQNAHKGVRRCYIIYPQAQELFRLERKRAQARPRLHSMARKLQSIEPTRRAEAQCIRIADPRGLYLTDGMIATHNTTGLAIRAVDRFLKGRRVLYAAPTYDQTERFWVEVKRALSPLVDEGYLRQNQTSRLIERVGTENRVRAKTAWDANSLRGDYADELILDEWQLMNEDAWELVGAPMLLDNDGDAVFLYTPPSLASRGVSKARDRRHAARMYAEALENPEWDAIHFTSRDNPHISATAIDRLESRMTALAIRQEIEAEDVDEVPGALWTREIIRYVLKAPEMVRIVVGVDPTGSLGNACGIVVAGLGADGRGYVLEDCSDAGLSPEAWGARAVKAYYQWRADRILGERNYGGDMVETVIRVVDPTVPYSDVNATRGKARRAEPVAALYEKGPKDGPEEEKGQVRHVGEFPKLEDEYCSWTPTSAWSPNRLDACLVAGTMVCTDGDDVPIERVRTGMRVLTRRGYREVRRAGLTHEAADVRTVEFSDGRTLTGTGEHPVWLERVDDFVPLGKLTTGDEVAIAPSLRPAPVNVARSFASGVAPVYNLTVADEPEFFANGILVHNCVWALTDLMLKPEWDVTIED